MKSGEKGRLEYLPIDTLELDLANPRIAQFLEMYEGEISAEQIALALGYGSSVDGAQGPSFSALKQSILTNEGIIHPIIVNRGEDGKFVVIEGNTRTQIYRELRQKKQDGNWDVIPAMVYDNLSEETIDSIRLQAHLVGTRDWDPYSKARYLDCLRNRQHLPFSQIVDFCGGDKHEVETYIRAYNDMEQHYRPILDNESDFDPSRFSAFVELQRPRVGQALVSKGYNKKDFSLWVHERKIHPLATVRKLPRILLNDESREIFLKSGAEEAIKTLDSIEALGGSVSLDDAGILELAKALCRKVNSMQWPEIQNLKKSNDSEGRETLIDTRDVLIEFCNDFSGEDL